MNSSLASLSAKQLLRAASLKTKIDKLQAELDSLLGGSNGASARPAVRKKRHISAAARERIAAAQRARWERWAAENKKKK